MSEWKIERCRDFFSELYTVSKTVNRRRVHLEYASDGQPMLYSRERAKATVRAYAERLARQAKPA